MALEKALEKLGQQPHLTLTTHPFDPNLMNNPIFTRIIAIAIATLTPIFSVTAHAGIYTLTQYHAPGNWSLGLEPEITLTDGSGFGLNAKFTYGLDSLSNLQFAIGPGSGAKGFRAGGGMTWDFIPDLEGQIGAGLATQLYIYKVRSGAAQTELTAGPYIHKNFKLSNGTDVEPYAALPFGIALLEGKYRGICNFATGAFFKLTPNFSYSLEIGLNIANSDSYLAGGVTYFN